MISSTPEGLGRRFICNSTIAARRDSHLLSRTSSLSCRQTHFLSFIDGVASNRFAEPPHERGRALVSVVVIGQKDVAGFGPGQSRISGHGGAPSPWLLAGSQPIPRPGPKPKPSSARKKKWTCVSSELVGCTTRIDGILWPAINMNSSQVRQA